MSDPLCAIHQPNFFPRLSTLAKLFTADIWIILDDVQFTRRDYQHRCLVAGPDTVERWLTVPVHLPAGRATLIRDVLIADPARARSRVAAIIRRDYRHTPYWPAIRDLLAQVDDVFACSDRLTDVSETSTQALLRALDWPGLIYRSSDLPARTGRSERLADLTLAVGASTYLCGTGGARYLDQQPFTTNGITVDHFRAPQPRQNITALSAFATAGPAKLATQLAEHASCWQPSPRRLPYAEGSGHRVG